jgi:2-hydroxychromene-2-carboxylate isomerase
MDDIRFYFEFISPYSYLASLQIEDIAEAARREVDWRPIEIEAVWEAQGVLEAYKQIRGLKRPYIKQDAIRCAAMAGVTLMPLPASARDTSLAKSAYWGLRNQDAELAKRFLQTIWHRLFGEGRSIASIDDMAEACSGLGLSAEDLLAAAAWEGARRHQDASNADAAACGCFGVPWFVADGESFFGQDRLMHLAAFLGATAA